MFLINAFDFISKLLNVFDPSIGIFIDKWASVIHALQNKHDINPQDGFQLAERSRY